MLYPAQLLRSSEISEMSYPIKDMKKISNRVISRPQMEVPNIKIVNLRKKLWKIHLIKFLMKPKKKKKLHKLLKDLLKIKFPQSSRNINSKVSKFPLKEQIK